MELRRTVWRGFDEDIEENAMVGRDVQAMESY
jgi:hypothetical protein